MGGTQRLLAAVAVTVAGLLNAGTAVADTVADTTGNQITRWDAVWDLQADGSVDVTLEFDFDFGDDPGHGPYLTFPTQADYGDGEHLRVYDIHDVVASSPSGAPADLELYWEDAQVTFRIGDEDVDDVSGV